MKTRQEMEKEQEDLVRMQKLENDHRVSNWLQAESERHSQLPWLLVLASVLCLAHAVCHG